MVYQFGHAKTPKDCNHSGPYSDDLGMRLNTGFWSVWISPRDRRVWPAVGFRVRVHPCCNKVSELKVKGFGVSVLRVENFEASSLVCGLQVGDSMLGVGRPRSLRRAGSPAMPRTGDRDF